mmetsp:Transcript_21679/g.49353  ORF Transcript_21679/g.49353 Transcript_21679/m.49353 type:complete len:429 (+) Transcript_21679:88-1374(+)
MEPGIQRPAIVIDIGSGYTKMGYAGNTQPHFVIPTCVANSARKASSVYTSQSTGVGVSDLEFYIGDEAYQRKDSPNYLLSYPVSKGRTENWDDMERFLQQAIFRKLRCTAEEHYFLLTEPPFSMPESRESMAEIMFETFNIKGLNMSVQAVLALYAQWTYRKTEAMLPDSASPDLTGLVVDAGDATTHIIPVADGYVIGSCIQELPIGGKHVTEYIANSLRDRGEPVPPECRMDAARQIKEQYGYVARDVNEESAKFDTNPQKRSKTLSGAVPKTREPWTISIAHERFMAPEMFFAPKKFFDTVTLGLPEVVDTCIRNCPIDTTRRLYGNVVLAGGSTTFLHFRERLECQLQRISEQRALEVQQRSGVKASPLSVQVSAPKARSQQKYAAWLGGSFFAAEQNFERVCHSKREYDEVGPSCMRRNPMLS